MSSQPQPSPTALSVPSSVASPRLAVRGLAKHFGGVRAVDDLDLVVMPGEIVSIIGPNGAGKTTLFNLITGLERPDRGSVWLDGRDITGRSPDQIALAGIARTFQQTRIFANMSVLDNVLVGATPRLRAARAARLVAPERRTVPGLNVLALVAETLLALLRPPAVRAEEAALRADARQTLSIFGARLLPRQEHFAYSLSYANRRRTELARALALRPVLLLLDEPTAGMNPAETNEVMGLIRTIRDLGITILLIEHKLDLVMRVSDRVVAMDYGKKIAEGTPLAVRHDEAVIEAYLGRRAAHPGAPVPAAEEVADG
jgi:branched-chain amino acid transport system ATP-binding protein